MTLLLVLRLVVTY